MIGAARPTQQVTSAMTEAGRAYQQTNREVLIEGDLLPLRLIRSGTEKLRDEPRRRARCLAGRFPAANGAARMAGLADIQALPHPVTGTGCPAIRARDGDCMQPASQALSCPRT